MEPTMEEKLRACIALCEEGDPEMCAFLGKEFYYGWNIPQDLDRALIVGTRTYGKGLVQSFRPVGYNGKLKLTIAKYYTPKGRDIHKNGIKPDIEVENTEDKDLQKEKAIEVIKSKIQ